MDDRAGPRSLTSTAALIAAVTVFTPMRDKPGTDGWLAAVAAVALNANCGTCWAAPGTPCPISTGGTHLARFARIRRAGLIGHDDLAAVTSMAGETRVVPAVAPLG